MKMLMIAAAVCGLAFMTGCQKEETPAEKAQASLQQTANDTKKAAEAAAPDAKKAADAAVKDVKKAAEAAASDAKKAADGLKK